MFTIKRPVIVFMLILLLVFTGYINHNLTKRASSRVSREYQEYEERELAKEKQSDNDLVPAISEGKDEEVEIIDSEDKEEDEANNVDGLIQDTEDDISETISNQENLKSKNYFVEQRLSRDKLRAGLVDRLNEIVNNDNSSQEMVTEAQRKIMQIGEIAEKELTIEGLIKAKGFNDALVFLTEKDAKVVVDVKDLTEQDVVKILDIVINETDLDASNVKIMKKN
jgi:stage III sporulation protein AH